MATLWFTILRLMGYIESEGDWYAFCLLLSIDTVGLMLLVLNYQLYLKWKKEGGGG